MATAIVTLPDGRRAKITADTRAAVIRKADELATTRVVKDQSLTQDFSQIREAVQGGDVGDLETVGRTGVARFLDSFFELPEDVMNAATAGARSVQDLPVNAGILGIPGIGQVVQSLQAAPENIDIPNPQASDVFAAAQLAGEAAGAVATGDFSQMTEFQAAKEQQERRTAQARKANPMAGAFGQALGDVAVLATGRAPLSVARRNAALRATPKTDALEPGARQLAKDIFQSDKAKSLKRAAGKATETGLEGATLAILNEGDPVEVAAWTAGGQLVGSLGLETFPPTRRGLFNFAATVGSLAMLLRFGQEFSPGQNSLWTAVDQSFEKAKYGLLAGAAASFVGAGRIGTAADAGRMARSFQKNAPAFTDALTAIPRGTVVSMTNSLLKGDEEALTVLDRMSANPQAFDESTRRKIMKSVKEGTVQTTISDLMKRKSFREKVETLQ